MLRRYYGKISFLPINEFVGHDGELVVDDITGKVYVMDGVTYGGTELVGAMPKYGTTPPDNPTPGALWYDPVSGRTYIYFQNTWVDAAPNTPYTLPVASDTVLGGIKVGNNLYIDEEGFLSAEDGNYTLPTASDTVLGGIKVGNGLTITDGVLNANVQTVANVLGNLTVYDQTIIPNNSNANVIIQGNVIVGNIDSFSFHSYQGIGNGAGYRFLTNTGGDDLSGMFHRIGTNKLVFEHSGRDVLLLDANGSAEFASNVFAGNINAISYHAAQGIGNGAGYRFLTNTGGDDISGMFHAISTNELVLDHTGRIGFRLNVDGEVELVRGFKFNNSNVFTLPENGDIHYKNGTSVLSSISGNYTLPVATEFILGGIKLGEGFSTNGDNKVTTNKLYSTNLTQPTQHYRLELDTNGVVHLPDQSIINGATLKSVAGNFAGITAGPIGKDEDSWVWVDGDGVWVATKYNTDQKLWQFNNDGNVILPEFGTINYSNGMSILEGVASVTEPSSTPPADPVSGQLWYDTDSGKIYVYLTDSWVDASPTLTPSSLVTGIYTVTLDSEGNLILPDGGDILDGDGNSVLSGGANAAAQQNTINYLLTNATIQSGNINALRANINAANAAIINANVGMKSYVDGVSTNWIANAASQAVNINTIFSNLSTQASNASAQQTTINYLLSNSASQDTQLIALRANITAANAAIITANVAMKSYVDSVTSSFDGSWVDNAATQAENINIIFGNIAVLKSNANSQQNTINYLLSNSATQDTQLSALRANINAANAAIITANVGMKSYIDNAVSLGTANAATQESRINDIYANLAVRVGNSTAQQNTINYLLLNAAVQSANIISLFSNAAIQADLITDLVSNAATQTNLIGVINANIAAANSVISTKTVYSNSNVAAYLPTYSGSIGGSITVGALLQAPQYTKAANATGTVGQICWDSNYIYVCTATNTWKRVGLTGGY
jgi:hypothetical protein